MDLCKENVCEALRLSHQLITLADEGEQQCWHDGGLLLCALFRDYGYEIKRAAEQLLRELAVRELSHGNLNEGIYSYANSLSP